MAALGTGRKVSAQDTVPFALWCASQRLGNYEEAFWLTVSELCDVDTTCAMVGGIVANVCVLMKGDLMTVQPLTDPASIATQYTTLARSICDIAESYYYLGRLDDALTLLNAGSEIVAQREVLPSDRASLLLQHGKLRATTIFLANGDVDLL